MSSFPKISMAASMMPSAASDLAMPAPMPFDAPVTTATLPASLPMGCSFQTGEGRTQGWMLREFGRFELLDDSACKGLDSGCMRPLFHPSIEEITVEAILHALADPVRVALYAEIVASACPRSCSSLMGISERAVPKSTLSQHFNVLREAGLIHSERRGVEMQNSSRCAEIERRFPGLLPAILAAHAAQQKTALRPAHAGRRKPAARST